MRASLTANLPVVVIGQLDDMDRGHWYAIEVGITTMFVPLASLILP
jgi:hypothetical protein